MKTRILLLTAAVTLVAGSASAASFMIGDNDGYGIGICDNCVHPFDGFNANYDGRSAAEMAATDGAQYTDTYSTTHPGFSPHGNETVATFVFSGLGNSWTLGHLEIDMADFQASTFGAVITTFNGIVEPFDYDDGFPNTVIHHYNLSAAVIASINLTGQLIITIDRNNSSDFYGFDYLRLNDFAAPVPEPGTLFLLGTGVAMVVANRRRRAGNRPA